MSEYFSTVVWERKGQEFTDNKYSRAHLWKFDGGVTLAASSSPHVVPLPYSVPENIDPEEAFVASLSSCHMLFFLSIAAKKKFIVEQYVDNAIGLMGKDLDGRMAMLKVTLRPRAVFIGGRRPSYEQLEKMHHQSHELCFLANSVKAEIVTEIID